jgi:chemotaxis methyl-accepting protein methylase
LHIELMRGAAQRTAQSRLTIVSEPYTWHQLGFAFCRARRHQKDIMHHCYANTSSCEQNARFAVHATTNAVRSAWQDAPARRCSGNSVPASVEGDRLRFSKGHGARVRQGTARSAAWLRPQRGRKVKSIESIEVGDLVWAWDAAGKELVKRRVNRLFRRSDQAVMDVTCVCDDGAEQTVIATTEHPFWVEGKGWTASSALRAGDVLKLISGAGQMRVFEVSDTGRRTDVFNFEVEGVHNYFVGSHGALVHNSSTRPTRQSGLVDTLARDDLEWSDAADEPNHTTWLFRDHRELEVASAHAADASRAAGREASVWVAAGADGSEAYTLAMMLEGKLGPTGYRVRSTDISKDIIAHAKTGFLESTFPPDPAGDPYYARFGIDPRAVRDGTQQMPDVLRSRIDFSVANLLRPVVGIGPFDVVTARNVLYHHEFHNVSTMVENILPHIRPGGLLIVDSSSAVLLNRLGIESLRRLDLGPSLSGIYQADFGTGA